MAIEFKEEVTDVIEVIQNGESVAAIFNERDIDLCVENVSFLVEDLEQILEKMKELQGEPNGL